MIKIKLSLEIVPFSIMFQMAAYKFVKYMFHKEIKHDKGKTI